LLSINETRVLISDAAAAAASTARGEWSAAGQPTQHTARQLTFSTAERARHPLRDGMLGAGDLAAEHAFKKRTRARLYHRLD
jgi:hypothetical protein